MKTTLLLACILFTGMTACNSQSTSSHTGPGDAKSSEAATPAPGFVDISVEEFKKRMTEPGIVLLDVRTPEETALGKIEGAIELDYKSPGFAAEVEKLDKSKTCLVYCHSGGRSSKTCQLMAEKGFKNLYNLKGGYSAWPKQ